MRDTKQKLSPVTIGLHWFVGLTFIVVLLVGFYMETMEAYALYPIHKSFGALLFFVIMVRVVWRVMNGWPVPLKDDNKLELFVAKLVHWVLIIGTVLMPLSGMAMSGAGGRGVFIFGLELIAANPDAANPGKVIPLNEALAGLGHTAHGIIAWVMVAAILAHIAGAIKHHHIFKNDTLLRMKGKEVE